MTTTSLAHSPFVPFLLTTHSDFTEEPTEATAEEIRIEAEKWVGRSKCMASLAVTIFIAWVVVAQVYRKDLPSFLYLYNADNAELTGW